MKHRLKKRILWICMMVPVVFIFNSLAYSGYNKQSMMEAISRVWAEWVFEGHLFTVVLASLYVSWYIISECKKLNVAKLLFVLAVVCWIAYFIYGIYYSIEGYKVGFMSTRKVYGLTAFMHAMGWCALAFTYIPVLPISLGYIIIYIITVAKKRRARKIHDKEIKEKEV